MSIALGTFDSWNFDFACCNHITPNFDLFQSKSFNAHVSTIYIADDSQMRDSHTRNISMFI